MDTFLEVRHNMEVAHRLHNLPGKCENIHGHSMWVTLRIYGKVNELGILTNHYGKPLDFADVKKGFRGHIDREYDHRVLLNRDDPFAQPLYTRDDSIKKLEAMYLPGLQTFDLDPTTEVLAASIGSWAQGFFAADQVHCMVQETHVNAAGVVLGGE